jgi:hypothetical protein
LVGATHSHGLYLLGHYERIVGALVQDFVQTHYDKKLLILRKVQKSILPHEFENSSGIGDERLILSIFLEYQPQHFLLVLLILQLCILQLLSRILAILGKGRILAQGCSW